MRGDIRTFRKAFGEYRSSDAFASSMASKERNSLSRIFADSGRFLFINYDLKYKY